MIHYHGAPCPGNSAEQIVFFRRRDCLLSFANREKVSPELLFTYCRTFILDNGSFSYWKNGIATNWDEFYKWVQNWMHHPRFEWFLIPDVIGGTTKENDLLIKDSYFPRYGVPVFHIGEPVKRISFFLDQGFKRFAIGSTPGFELKSMNFWNEMRKVFNRICIDGIPIVKAHGLRMLDPEIVEAFPFSSCDSATASMESIFDYKWKHHYWPRTQSGRAALVADYLEQAQSPSAYQSKPIQIDLGI